MNLTYKNPFHKTTKQDKKPSIEITLLPTDKIIPNPNQPRFIFEDEPLLRLADSIRRFGILQPLSVRPTQKNEDSPIIYQIIAGERRWRAARIIGLN